jgi:CHRD domain
MKNFQWLVRSMMLIGFFSVSANAANIAFDLKGTAGTGLLAANEPAAPIGGSGGEIGAGIFFDDVTNLLTVNVGWGSSQGFVDLTSLSNNSHIHGPTASNNGAGFTQTAGVVVNLTRSSNAVTGGVITNAPIALTAAQKADLLNGKYYINIHTVNNGGGEIRGFLVPVAPTQVPLDSWWALLLIALFVVSFGVWKFRKVA